MIIGLTGKLLSLARQLKLPSVQTPAVRANAFHPKRSCLLLSGTTVVGWFGEIHPELCEKMDVRGPLVAAELDITALAQMIPKELRYKPVNPFPPVRRDLSLVMPAPTPFQNIAKTLQASAGPMLEAVSLIDLFEGEKIGANRKAMTVSLTFRHPERTLTDIEIEKTVEKILVDLNKRCEAELRK